MRICLHRAVVSYRSGGAVGAGQGPRGVAHGLGLLTTGTLHLDWTACPCVGVGLQVDDESTDAEVKVTVVCVGGAVEVPETTTAATTTTTLLLPARQTRILLRSRRSALQC